MMTSRGAIPADLLLAVFAKGQKPRPNSEWWFLTPVTQSTVPTAFCNWVVQTVRLAAALLTLAAGNNASPQPLQPGSVAHYNHQARGELRPSVVREFSLSIGSPGPGTPDKANWIHLTATKAGGEQFSVWLLSDEYPPADLESARRHVRRYIVQEGSERPREYRNPVTGEAVLPSSGAWEHLFPRVLEGSPPQRVRLLGHVYVQQSVAAGSVRPPVSPVVVELRPDMLVGPAGNTRQKDETRRYDGSDYELTPLKQQDYAEMADAGINCVRVDASQAQWAHALNIFYWGDSAGLPYPELLYRSQYLGAALYLDEPAVGTRDHELLPRLRTDAAFRKSITPELAFDAFRKYFARTVEHVPMALVKSLAARPEVDIGAMSFLQPNLHSWETMVSTAAYQLSQHPHVPESMVFEPPGRIGTRRTIPEINMTYGVQLPADDPKALTAILFGFLRGAARLTGKNWGVSIYGAVQHADTFWWLTHAYDLGATRFLFYDSYQLACVPYSEYLAMARHLRLHAKANPVRDLARLRRSAEVAILLPPGYNLGHVFIGKGILWGIGELNLERVNRKGVKYRAVMSSFFIEIERCLRSGVSFDLLWDLPGMKLTGYRDVIRVRDDGTIESTTGRNPKPPVRPPGVPPELSVSLAASSETGALELTANAHVIEKTAPVYYTFGADTQGIYHNARVAWELYGPGDEDYLFILPRELKPRVRVTAEAAEVKASVRLYRPGSYRLRVSTVDLAGRSTVLWRPFKVQADPGTRRLTLRQSP